MRGRKVSFVTRRRPHVQAEANPAVVSQLAVIRPLVVVRIVIDELTGK
jgi:hypothetical protein